MAAWHAQFTILKASWFISTTRFWLPNMWTDKFSLFLDLWFLLLYFCLYISIFMVYILFLNCEVLTSICGITFDSSIYLFTFTNMQDFCLFQHKMTKKHLRRRWERMSFISIISNITLLIIDVKDIFNLLYLNILS